MSDYNRNSSWVTGIRKKETLINLLYMARFPYNQIQELINLTLNRYEGEELLSLYSKILKSLEENDLESLFYSPLTNLELYSKKELRLLPKTIPALKLVENGEEIFDNMLYYYEDIDGFNENLMRNITISLLNQDEPYTWDPSSEYNSNY